MDNKQFKDWMEKHTLSTDKAAIVLGISRSNAFKYANGSGNVPKYVKFSAEAIDLLNPTECAKLISRRLSSSTN